MDSNLFSGGSKDPFHQIMEEMKRERERREEEEKERRKEFREETRETKKLRIEFVAISVALLATVFTGWQAFEARQARVEAVRAAETARKDAREAAEDARRQSESMLNLQTTQSKLSAELALRSANAAEQSAVLAGKALHISERAYVDLIALVLKPLAKDEFPSFKISVKNSGRTPASDVEGVAGMVSQSAPFEENVAYERSRALLRAPMLGTRSRAFMSQGANADFIVTGNLLVTESVLTAIKEQKIIIYIFGQVTYRDVFQILHHSNYCGKYNGELKTFDVCERFNTAD